MAHITPQSSFRVGKTFLWQNNSLITTKQFPKTITGNISKVKGLELLFKYLLRKRRFFIVKANIKYCLLQAKHNLNILFLPKMKKSPKLYMKRLVLQTFIHKKFYSQNKNFLNMFKNFSDLRREKIFKFPPEREDAQIN
jgi:hypothetical protein